MHELTHLLGETVASGLRRKSITTPSQWARTYRVMGPPFPGPWSERPAPWTLGMHDSKAPLNVGMKGAQLGFSETTLDIAFFSIDMERKDVAYILPTKTPDASEFSSARFDAALDLSAHLSTLFSDVKNVGHKRAGSANLYVRGSNSRSSLKSIPVARLFFDEYDEMNAENVVLAEERVSGQIDPIIWKISTPTVPGKKIDLAFSLSTQEHWVFKCPHCSRYTELIFPDCLVITAEEPDDPKIKDSYLVCKECKHKLDHRTKTEWLGINNAHWEPFGRADADARGFHVSQLYSIPRAPYEIAILYLKSLTDKASEQEFYNSKLGLAHVVEGSQLNKTQVENAIREVYGHSGTLITMGVDQGKWLHYEIDAWRFPGYDNDLNNRASCQVLKVGKCIDFEELDVLMKEYQVMSCVIDAQPERRSAYDFACRFWGHVKLCYYAAGQSKKMISVDPTEEEHKITVDRTSWLDVALNRYRTGSITLPPDTPKEYIEHLTNLARMYKVKDETSDVKAYYETLGPDHYAHARNYSEIALPIGASLASNKNIKVFL